MTTTGAAPDKPCIFPFIHEDVEYNECISYEHGEHWCSTKVNETGNKLDYLSGLLMIREINFKIHVPYP